MKHSLAVTAFFAAVVMAAGCGGSSTQETEATGTIAFSRAGQVWLMSADGSGQRALTRGVTPVWSPDGRRLAFGSSERVFVINADGSGRLRLTGPKEYTYGYYHSPVWSPAGRTIAFEWYDDGYYGVYVVDADGSRERRVTLGREYAGPAWSPNGRLITFTHIHEGAVYVMRPDGGGRRVLARMEEADATWGVAWSPDGRRIAFIRDSYLWVMNADGTRPRRLVDHKVDNPGARYGDFAWSPDGRRIAFSMLEDGLPRRFPDADSEIFVVNVDGSGLRNLTDNDRVLDDNPVWSPDGRAIAFTSDRDGNTEIYVMDADGSNERNVSQSPAEDYGPAWSPRG